MGMQTEGMIYDRLGDTHKAAARQHDELMAKMEGTNQRLDIIANLLRELVPTNAENPR